MALTNEELITRLAAARFKPGALDKVMIEQAFRALCQLDSLGQPTIEWAADPAQGCVSAMSHHFADSRSARIYEHKYQTGYLTSDPLRGVRDLMLPEVAARSPFQIRRERRNAFDAEIVAQNMALQQIPYLRVRAESVATETQPFDPKAACTLAWAEVQAPWIVASHGLLEPQRAAEALLAEHFLRAYESGLGLYWVFSDRIIAVPRPTVHTEEHRRFHCATGPAIEWSEGLKFWYWQGVQVTEKIILHPETMTIDEILNERNLEVKRVMLERFGHERLVKEGKARKRHRTRQGTLYCLSLPGYEPLVIVEVICPSTGRNYWLRVPPQIQHVREAVAWTFSLRENEYQPVQET